jgi:hypothetical protein
MVYVGFPAEQIERRPVKGLPRELGDSAGAPSDRTVADALEGEIHSFPPEVKIEQAQAVGTGCCSEMLDKIPCVAADPGPLAKYRLNINADLHAQRLEAVRSNLKANLLLSKGLRSGTKGM